MIYYETTTYNEVKKRKGPNAGKLVTERKVYRTKTHTDYHRQLVAQDKRNRTLKYDTSIDWPFGVFAEVVDCHK